jgi:hypothetical protein
MKSNIYLPFAGSVVAIFRHFIYALKQQSITPPAPESMLSPPKLVHGYLPDVETRQYRTQTRFAR